MKRGDLLIFLIFQLAILHADIFKYTSFESGTYEGWVVHQGDGEINLLEDPPYPDFPYCFKRQSHGAYSVHIVKDTGSTYPTYIASGFPHNAGNEYMVDFYFRIPPGSQSHWNFSLYKSWLGNGGEADIEVLLTNWGGSFFLIVWDVYGPHYLSNVVDEDTSDYPETWHRIQIYKKNENITLLIDGDSLGTYVSQSDIPPDSIGIGAINPNSKGEIIVDDIIISTPPEGIHPIAFFSADDLPEIREKRYNNDPGYINIAPSTLWDTIITRAERDLVVDSMVFFDTLVWYYPFSYPPPTWDGIMSQAYYPQWVHYLSFAGIVEDDTAYINRAKKILLELCRWQKWERSDVYHIHMLYGNTGHAHMAFALGIGYDLIYPYLNNLEKMTIQNTLISMAVEQLYLSITLGVTSDTIVIWNKKIMAALGLAYSILVGDLDTLFPHYLDEANDIILNFLTHSGETYSQEKGATREPMLYGDYKIIFITAYADLLRRKTGEDIYPLIQNHYIWRVCSYLPGGNKYIPFGDSGIELDLDAMYRHADEFSNPVIAWFLRENNDYVYGYGLGLGGDYIFFSGFLWINNQIVPVEPEEYGFKKGMVFETPGWAILRTGYGYDDFLFGITSKDNGVFHSQHDNNTIVLGYRGKWFIGENQDIYGSNRTSMHNTILIDDTLGQISGRNLGSIEKFYVDDIYGFVSAEACSSYKSYGVGILESFKREALLLNQKKVLLIKDLIKSNLEPHRIKWLFHTYRSISSVTSNYIKISDDTASLVFRWQSPNTSSYIRYVQEDSLVWKELVIRTSQPVDETYLIALVYPESLTVSISTNGNKYETEGTNWIVTGAMNGDPIDSLTLELGNKNDIEVFLMDLMDSSSYYFVAEKEGDFSEFGDFITTSAGTRYLHLQDDKPYRTLYIFSPGVLRDSTLTAYHTQPKIYHFEDTTYIVYNFGDYMGLKKIYGYGAPEEEFMGPGSSSQLVYLNNRIKILTLLQGDIYLIDPEAYEITPVFRSKNLVIYPPTASTMYDTLYVSFYAYDKNQEALQLKVLKYHDSEIVETLTVKSIPMVFTSAPPKPLVAMSVGRLGNIKLLTITEDERGTHLLEYFEIDSTLRERALDTIKYPGDFNIFADGRGTIISYVKNDSLFVMYKPIDEQDFKEPQYISRQTFEVSSPVIVDGRAIVFEGSEVGKSNLIYVVTKDEYSWSEPMVVSDPLGNSFNPQATLISSNTMRIAWTKMVDDKYLVESVLFSIPDRNASLQDRYLTLPFTLRYQNPTGEPTIHLSSFKGGPVSFRIYDVSGRLIIRRKLTLAPGDHIVKFNLNHSGVYFVETEAEGKRWRFKWVVLR